LLDDAGMTTAMRGCMFVAGVVVALAGCMPPTDERPTEVREVLSETSQGLTWTSTVTTRGVYLSANVLTDWSWGTQISPTIVGNHTLKVRYCAAHFPPNSPQLTNLTAALNAYSGVAGVAINLTDIAPEPNTATHPDLSTFTLPADAIYVDYKPNMSDYASTVHPPASCDSASPRRCTQARLYVNADTYIADSPSKGVFMHELGHVFGMEHINGPNDGVALINPWDMWFDRTTIHGNKLDSDDFRGLVIHAATLAFLRNYYPATTNGTLDTDEIVAHRNMSMVGDEAGGITPHFEWDFARSFEGWGTGASLVDGLNEIKLKWNPTADVGGGQVGGFEPCSAPGTLPHWFARMSETSTNTVDTLFDAVFEVTNNDAGTNWTQVASRTFDSYIAGQEDFRQIDWDRTFPLSAAALGTPSTGVTTRTVRKLRFRADANNSLTERNEANNDWEVTVCLYPSTTSCSSAFQICEQ
jgi:hypothetical protein